MSVSFFLPPVFGNVSFAPHQGAPRIILFAAPGFLLVPSGLAITVKIFEPVSIKIKCDANVAILVLTLTIRVCFLRH